MGHGQPFRYQPLAGHPLHIFRSDLAQLFLELLGQFDIQTQGTEHAQLHGLPHHRVLFEHLAGQHAGPHPRHFIFTGQGGLQGLDLLAQSLFYLLEGDTRIGSRCQRKGAIAALNAAVAGTGTGH